MMLRKIFLLLITASTLIACSEKKVEEYVELQNPILPGYFADPSLVQHDGKFYLYATADPWGANFLSCWESTDFQNWTFNKLNWPTKEACSSPLSTSSMVWAPSVIKKGDKFYMYVSVGSEVWCGVADHPLGPWQNMLGDKQMIEHDTTRFYHAIDAEIFIDDDQRAYLYWGSGWNWINGHCYVAELNDDMCTFKTEKKEVTPTNYFEGPIILKDDSKYYLTYSEGRTMDDTYEVRYAVSDSPLGPFEEGENSPILTTNKELDVYGPGHHTLFSYEGKNYMLYHRHRLPFETETAFRQLCISEITVDREKSQINTIVPYSKQVFPKLVSSEKGNIQFVSVKASSESADYRNVSNLSDNSYATRWEASKDEDNPSLSFEFAPETTLETLSIQFEYPWKKYYLDVEVSTDGEDWTQVADYKAEGIEGSPVEVLLKSKATFVRINFNANSGVSSEEDGEVKSEYVPSIWEVKFF